MIVPNCLDSDHSKIYYIGFEGIATKKKQQVSLKFNYELMNSNKISGLEEGKFTAKLGHSS